MSDPVMDAMSAMAAEKSAGTPDLVATSLVKVYGDRTVVNGMSVNCSCGEIVGILGPNGAGKTTTFYMVVGLVKPEEGKVEFRGEDITRLPVYVRARKGLGYLAQEPSVFRKLSVWDNVMAILETLPLSRKKRAARADVKRLRRHNQNASENSTHRYGTTFDISYWHYVKVPELRGRPYEDVPPEYLRATLGQVLKDLHDTPGTCYVKYEKKQSCFHITVRK